MNPYVAAGAALGAVVLLSQRGNVLAPYAGAADAAAMQALRTSMPIAGVTFTVPASNSPVDAYVALRDAMINKFGSLPPSNAANERMPAITLGTDLGAICGAWLAAARAASSADYAQFPLADSDFPITIPVFGNVGAPTGTFNTAYQNLKTWSDALTLNVSPGDVQETFARVKQLAAELESDYATTGGRSTDQGWTWTNVEGGLEAAGTASASFVAGVAGDAAGKVAGALASSSLVWAAALGFVAWKVLR